MTERPPGLAPATVVVAAGRPDRAPGAPVNVPIELSSTYAAHPTLGADGVATNLGYGRASNSTWEAFEAAVGALEGGQALCFASGMAAISAALAVLPADGALVAPRTPYNTSGALIGEVEAAGREVRRVDVQDTAAVVAALDGAGAIWLESPTNPLMEVADLPVIIAAARERGVVVVCDNTLSAAMGERSERVKIRHSTHSLTKLTTVRDGLGIVHGVADSFSKAVKALCEETVSPARWDRFVTAYTGLDNPNTGKRAQANATATAQALHELWAHDTRVTPWQNTAYGVVAAANTWLHHKAEVRGADRPTRNMERAITGKVDAFDTHTLEILARV